MKRFLIISSMLLVMLFITGDLFAQGGQNTMRERLRYQYEYGRTDEIIQQAQSVITASGTSQGKLLLDAAVVLQQQAKQMGENSMWVNGTKVTLDAREKAKQAVYANKQADENEALVLRQLEKTDDLIDRVEASADPDAVPRAAMSLFDSARENQKRAWEFYRQNQLRPALKLSRQAEKTIRGLIERVKEEKGSLNRIRNRLRLLEGNYEQMKDRVRECGSDEALKLLEQAEFSYKKGKEFYNNGQLRQAEKQLSQCRQMLTRAIDLCPNNGNLEKRINRIKNELSQMKDIAAEAGSGQAMKLVLSAEEHLQQAEQLCAGGQDEKCVANIRAAEISLDKARKILEL